MRLFAVLLAICPAACSSPTTRVESVEPVAPLEAPAPAPPIPLEEPVASAGRPPSTSEAVRQRIEELFVLCDAGHLEEAAGYVVYRGQDSTKKWKTVCDASSEECKTAVLGVCNRIGAYLDASESYSFEGYETGEESEGVWHVWEVVFVKGDDRQTAHFAFLMVEGVYALGDID